MCDGHSVARNNHDALRFRKQLDRLVNGDGYRFRFNGGAPTCGGFSPKTAKDYRQKPPVHCSAHDVTQDRAA